MRWAQTIFMLKNIYSITIIIYHYYIAGSSRGILCSVWLPEQAILHNS